MPRSARKPVSSTSRRRGAQRSQRPSVPAIDPYTLLGMSSALALVDSDEDIARLTAGAVTSTLALPFGAVVLCDDTEPTGRVFGQLNNAPLKDDLAQELASLVDTSGMGAGALASGSSVEIDVRESTLPHATGIGLGRLLAVRLGTVETAFGVVIAGRRSREPYLLEERTALEALAGQVSIALHRAWLYEESKELAKLQERNRLAHEIHDTLAQSLIGIILELELAERMMRTDVAAARGEMERARAMAREALDEARRSVLALRPSMLDKVSLAEAVPREIETLGRDGIAVEASVSGQPVPLGSEAETAFYRITQEAVANIRKHAQATRVAAVVDFGQEAVTLTISDNGTGFDLASLGPADEHGGFGLTSMRQRATLLGGDLQVESAPGNGTRITVRIPYAGARPPQPEPQPETTAPQPESAPPIRVLLADDHAVARQGIRTMLEEAADIEVVAEAADGKEALEKARAFRPDLVLTDVQMPGMGGIELVAALKAEGLASRTIILTAHLQGDLIVEAMKAGADGYLLKDARGPELVNAVRAVHKGETFLQPAAASELARRVGAASERDSVMALTPRELEVLGLLAEGLRNKEIAREKALSEATVRFHVAHIFEKLEVGSRTEAVTKALRLGIISQQ